MITALYPLSLGERLSLIHIYRVKTQRTVEKIDQEIKKLQKEIEGKGTVIECPRFGKVLYNGQECFHGVLTDEVSGTLAKNIPMQLNASQDIPTLTNIPQDTGREVKTCLLYTSSPMKSKHTQTKNLNVTIN